jgi:hypothetical protein
VSKLQIVSCPPVLIRHDPSSCIHTYLFLFHRATIPNMNAIRACSRYCHQPRYCPNCKHAVSPPNDTLDGPRWKLYDQNHNMPSLWRGPAANNDNNQLELMANDGFMFDRSHGHGNDLWDAEMAARESIESSVYQTSGCNTPRRSAETLVSSRFSGDVNFLDEGHFDSLV